MYKDADSKPCTWFINGESICVLNGAWCMCPFSELGCKIQGDEIFHYSTYINFKEDKEQLPVTKESEFLRKVGAEGRIVADYFIPYSKIDTMNVTPFSIIKNAIDIVREKYNKGDCYTRWHDAVVYIIQNAESILGERGIYVIKL